MALLQIKLQEPLYTNHSLEAIFYDYYSDIAKTSFEKFIPLYRVARLMDVSPERAKSFLIRSKTVMAIEAINLTRDTIQILVHPETLVKLLRTRFKRGLKNLYIEH